MHQLNKHGHVKKQPIDAQVAGSATSSQRAMRLMNDIACPRTIAETMLPSSEAIYSDKSVLSKRKAEWRRSSEASLDLGPGRTMASILDRRDQNTASTSTRATDVAWAVSIGATEDHFHVSELKLTTASPVPARYFTLVFCVVSFLIDRAPGFVAASSRKALICAVGNVG